jgi:hypothetical protein
MTLPALRCRPLDGNRDGQFLVEVLAPTVLVFAPNRQPRAVTHQQLHAIRSILIIEVTMNV